MRHSCLVSRNSRSSQLAGVGGGNGTSRLSRSGVIDNAFSR
jgi:hypothetical protein